jgi:hypothetical protein
MALKDIAQHVKQEAVSSQSTPAHVQSQAPKPTPSIIGPKTIPVATRPARSDYRGTSINKIAQQMGAVNKYTPESTAGVTWEQCACRKEEANVSLCTKFLAKCAMDKCPKKYIEIKMNP